MDDNAFFKWIQQHARFSEPEPVHVEGLKQVVYCIAKVEGNHQMLFSDCTFSCLTPAESLKELKDGSVTELVKFQNQSWEVFKEAGDRIVALAFSEGGLKLAVYENHKLLRTYGKESCHLTSLVLDGSMAYLTKRMWTEDWQVQDELIEVNVENLEEKLLLANVCAFSGEIGRSSFVAVSKNGIVHASHDRKLDLKEVFKQMNEACYWTAVLSLGPFAVVAGWSSHNIVDGSPLKKNHNFMLLISLTSLTVINQKKPLTLEWMRNSSSMV